MNRFESLIRARRESRVSRLYPITHLNAAHVFETRTGMMGCVIKVEGIPFVTQTNGTLNQLNNQLHQAISMLDERFIVYVTIHRKRDNLSLTGEFKSPFAATVNAKYHARFNNQSLYRNDMYVTVVLKGNTSGKVARGVGWFKRMKDVRSSESHALCREQNRATLESSVVQLKSQLAPFEPHVLGEQDKALGFSELMRFLSLIPNGGEAIPFARPVFCPSIANSMPSVWTDEALYPNGHLGQYLCAKRILFGDYIQFQGAASSDTRFGAVLSVKKYGKGTGSMVLDALLQMDAEFISTHTFAPESRDSALKAIQSKRGQLEITDDLGVTQISQLSELEDDIASETGRLGLHHNTILLLNDSKKALESVIVDATRIYGAVDMMLVKELATFGLEPAFWAQIPGNHHFITRASLITSNNFVDFCSLHNERTGFRDGNHLGGAVTLLDSVSKTPVYFNYHCRSSKSNPANGHTAVYGATQSGKNTLVAFMDTQMGRYNGRSFFLDRDCASKIYVLASGNSAYTVLSPSQQSTASLNPFQLPDLPENRTFLKSWFAELIKLPDEGDVPASIGELINDCVNYAYDSLSQPYRQLSHVVKCLPRNFPRWPELSRWLRGRDGLTDGEFAWLFDNESDTLSFDYDKLGFDITYLMDEVSSLISTPVYMVLLHRMRQSLDGRLTSFILDEAWQVLNTPFWIKVLNDWLPSIRKKNGHFIFMTQSPETVVQSSIAAIIKTNVSTTIAFPNPSAMPQVYKDGLGFSESEFQTIRDTNPQSRLFLYRQDRNQSMLCRLDLSALADEIRVFSANQSSLTLLDSIMNEVGANEVTWLPVFMERSRA